MNFREQLVIIRGGGDLATAVTLRLHKCGFPVIVLELKRPLVVRRRVAVATAVNEGHITIETLHAQRVDNIEQALEMAYEGKSVPVLVSPNLPTINSPLSTIIIDARMAKRNIDTSLDQAELVIGLGPGFTARVDCHVVIETMRGHWLGRAIWEGAALPNTGTPGIVAGKGAERVLRAPTAGVVQWQRQIGDFVTHEELLGNVNGEPVYAPFDGVIRGLIMAGIKVKAGLKIGDVDARAEREACFTISDKGLAIAGGVLEAILTHLNKMQTNQNESN